MISGMEYTKEIASLVQQYNSLKLHEVIDYDKFNEYTISHHSTAIEGASLTLLDTQLLLDEGTTPKGKPIIHSQMVVDHHNALKYILSLKQPFPLSIEAIQQINARVMATTGAIYNTALGSFDSSKGEFRKLNVRAGETTFPNYDKVPQLCNRFLLSLNDEIIKTAGLIAQYQLSFKAHFNLVSIHPFADGNGRTSRLLMNLVQEHYRLPLSIVFKEDKKEYILALQRTEAAENIEIFYSFMFSQLAKQLSGEIERVNKKDKGLFLTFL